MSMVICVATMTMEATKTRIDQWLKLATTNPQIVFRDNTTTNLGVLASYQWLYEQTSEDLIAYIHEDVEITEEGWDEKVIRQFDNPLTGVVGFGGAIQHGSDDLYRTPYKLQQLGRFGYRSNTRDAEVHGERFKEDCEAATLDGFALVVRRELLIRAGGWPVGTPVGYVGYDYWLSSVAHRFGYTVRLVGVGCQHLGGLTAVRSGVKIDPAHHAQAHRWLYDNFADVLPWRCQ